MITQKEYKERRQKLIQQLPKNAALILTSATIALRNGDAEYPYRQNSDFHYLTGWPEPEAILVLLPNAAQGEYILFTQPRDPEREKWTGTRMGPEGAKELFCADRAFSIAQFSKKILELLKGRTVVYISEADLQKIKNPHGFKATSKIKIRNALPLIHNLRLIKSSAEIALMQKAADISAAAHIAVMKACRPGLLEHQLEAEFMYHVMQQGARELAYQTIVAGGKNATVLHYVKNNEKLNAGELVLIDAGCEYQHYASDITRTFPVNGKFSPEQRVIYEIVLDGQMAVIDACCPGATKPELQALSEKKLTQGLIDAGILKGKLEALIEKKSIRSFYYHGVSHWIGMDVHDVGGYVVNKKPHVLQHNMALTVEPGLYFSPSDLVDKRFHGIGIRIEDDVVVTEKTPLVLSKNAPKTIAEMESLALPLKN